MEKVYKIGKSEIEGNGLIAIKDLAAGDLIGMSHSGGQPSSEIGQYYNHSDSPNAISELVGDDRYVIAASPIRKGEEIVVDYRKQPELEQPEDFLDKALDGGDISYPISGRELPRAQDGVETDAMRAFRLNRPIYDVTGRCLYDGCSKRYYDSPHDFSVGMGIGLGKQDQNYMGDARLWGGYSFNPEPGSGSFRGAQEGLAGYFGGNIGGRMILPEEVINTGEGDPKFETFANAVGTLGYKGEWKPDNDYTAWLTGRDKNPLQYGLGAYYQHPLMGNQGPEIGGYANIGNLNFTAGYTPGQGMNYGLGLGLPIRKQGGSLPKSQDGEEVKDYFTSYLNSDLFKRRAIDLHGEGEWEKVRDSKLKRLEDTEVDFSGEEEWADIYATDYSKSNLMAILGLKEKFDRLQSRYMRPGYDGNSNPIIKVNPGQAITMGEDHNLSYNPFNSIVANEYSHALGAMSSSRDPFPYKMTEEEIQLSEKRKLSAPYDSHDSNFWEMKSDIDTTRYELWKAGLYNFEEDFMFDQSHIDYIRNNPDKFIKDENLFKQYNDDTIVDMMNTFTDNSSIPLGMSKNGGSLPKAQRGLFFPKKSKSPFKIDIPPTNVIGSGLFGNKLRYGVGFGQNSLNDANLFHNQWYNHPQYESGVNTINQWNKHEQNQRLAGYDPSDGARMFNDPDFPIVHKSALWKDDLGNYQIDLTGVDPLASKFSLEQWNTGIIPEGFVFKKDFTDASGQNMHELYPRMMLDKGVNRTKQNADNLKIHGFFDEFKHNWRNRPSVSNILSRPYIPTWEKPFRVIGSYTNPFIKYIKDSSLTGGHASSFGSGTQYIDDGKVKLKHLRNDIAPKFRIDNKGFNNLGLGFTGYQALNNNPLFSLTDDLGSVVVHERGHQMDNQGGLWPEKYKKDFELAIDPNYQTTSGKIGDKLGLDIGTGNINILNMKPYFSTPTEQYARMMQERHRLGLKPGDEYTLDMFKENPNMFGMGKYLKTERQLIPGFTDIFGIYEHVPIQFIKNMNNIKEEGGELPEAQFGKGFKLKTPKLNIKPIRRFTDAVSRYNYNRSKDIFGNTGLSLSGSSIPYINRAASINSFRGLQNVGNYDPETIALMNEYTVDSAPFKLTDQELANSPWQMSTMTDGFGDPLIDADGWSKLALSNKIQGNQIGFKNTSFESQPLSLTRNWNEGQSLVGESGNIGDLRAALNSGEPIQLGDITSWSAGEHGSSQFGNNRYVIKDFNLDTPALLNEYKGLSNNQAKVWKEREILLDNPKFQVTNIIDNAPRLPHWSIETSPNTTFTRTDDKGDLFDRSVWEIGKDFNLSGKPVVTQWNPFARIMPNGHRNPWYESMYEASILDPKFRAKAVPQYGKDIELQIVKKKGGETKKKSKYQSSPFTKGKQTLTDPSKLLNTMIKQGIFTAKFKMGGEQSLGNGFTVKKEFDGAKNIPYVTYMSSPDIEGRIYYDSDSGEGMNDFNIIDIESELLKRQRKHRRTKDIILKYRNGEELTHTERSHLNSLGLLD